MISRYSKNIWGSIRKKNPPSVLVSGGQLELKTRVFVFLTSVREQVTALGGAIEKHLRQPWWLWVAESFQLLFPALYQSEWCSAGLCDFYTVLCYLTGMSLITQWTKSLNWNAPCAVGGNHKHFSVNVRAEPCLNPFW